MADTLSPDDVARLRFLLDPGLDVPTREGANIGLLPETVARVIATAEALERLGADRERLRVERDLLLESLGAEPAET